jgi:hypothetical protein
MVGFSRTLGIIIYAYTPREKLMSDGSPECDFGVGIDSVTVSFRLDVDAE